MMFIALSEEVEARELPLVVAVVVQLSRVRQFWEVGRRGFLFVFVIYLFCFIIYLCHIRI